MVPGITFILLGLTIFQSVKGQNSIYYYERDIYNSTALTIDNGAYCHGLLSCADIDTITSTDATQGKLYCHGARSCQLTSSLDLGYTVYAYGYLSAAGSGDITTDLSIFCDGEGSCIHIDEINTPFITCQGLNSCRFNILTDNTGDIDKLYARGMYSFQNSQVYSHSNADNYYYFLAWYAGYNSNIICNDGDSCKTVCYGNGCEGLNLYCVGSSSYGNTCIVECDDTTGHICPNINVVSDINAANSLIATSGDISDIGSYSDDYSIGFFDIFEQYYTRISSYDLSDEDDIVECEANSDYDNCNDNYVVGTCDGVTLTVQTDETICCRGMQSCRNGRIWAYKNTTSYCRGYRSCDGMSIKDRSSAGDVGTLTLECGGSEACYQTTIYDFDNVIVTGKSGIRGAGLNDVNYVGCFASYGCYLSNLNDVSYVYATGYRSLLNANIDNSNLNYFEIYLLGYDSGANLDITCDTSSGTTTQCKIYCFNNDICSNLGTVNCNCDYIYLA